MRVELSESEVCDIRRCIIFRLNYCSQYIAGPEPLASPYWENEVKRAKEALDDFNAKTKAKIESALPGPTGYADEFGGWKAHQDDRIQ